MSNISLFNVHNFEEEKKQGKEEEKTKATTKRKNIGRQKIEIKKVVKESNRYVTFSKRKSGLFKKATELSNLCGAEVAVIIFSAHQKLFACGHPDVDEVINRYLRENSTHTDQSHAYGCNVIDVDHDNKENVCNYNKGKKRSRESILAQEQEYNGSVERLEREKSLVKKMKIGNGSPSHDNNDNHYNKAENENNNHNEYFWWNKSMDGMEEDELKIYKESMEKLKSNLMSRLDAIADQKTASESEMINQLIDDEWIATEIIMSNTPSLSAIPNALF